MGNSIQPAIAPSNKAKKKENPQKIPQILLSETPKGIFVSRLKRNVSL
jgi:hypothetical protein